jgi:diadenosine tetraphosphate (Ap4A) HIT family hydrolase
MTPDERLAALESGCSPFAIARMTSGFAVMGDQQYLAGYCLLLAFPKVAQLNDLPEEDQLSFLADMAQLGAAVRAATGCMRVNYGIYGNLDPFLHAHVWPRYASEDESMRTMPPFTFPADFRNAPEHVYDAETHDPLKLRIAAILKLSESKRTAMPQ